MTSPGAALHQQGLLDAARGGDQVAFGALIEPYRRELHAHGYRMLGSLHDTEDALQDALLRAWRGLPRFDGRGSVRAWLYRIATNTCLDTIARRPTRTLPLDQGPAADPYAGPGEPLVESVWIEPYPADSLEDGKATPEARYELRESVELAFVAALQTLPGTQRAVLILREVLGFSAQETADALETSVASVNSALQRARKAVEERAPERSQQATLRALGDERLQALVEQYIDAMNRGDVDEVVSMLAEDVAWSMPPLASWFGGLEGVRVFLATGPLSGQWRWKRLATSANAQPAVGAYVWHDGEGCYRAFALDVLTLEGDRISDVTAFIVRQPQLTAGDTFRNYPDEPVDEPKVVSTFERFGLPARLD